MFKLDGKDIVDIIVFMIALLIVGFFIGWLFPVEGPIDYIYDEVVKKAPAKAAPAQTNMYHLIININDLSEEDFEALQEIFRNKGEQ